MDEFCTVDDVQKIRLRVHSAVVLLKGCTLELIIHLLPRSSQSVSPGYVISARLKTNRLPDQCLNETPNACDYHQQSHTGGRSHDETMDARQCLICITCSDWMSGCTVGKKEAMVPLCR